MLQGIEVQNYRGIRQGRVTGLGRINLFVGPNGSGKSSLLEALFLGAHNRSNNSTFSGFQGHPVPILGLRHNESSFPTTDVWYGKIPQEEVRIEYTFEDTSGVVRIATPTPGAGIGIDAQLSSSSDNYFQRMRFLDIRILLDHDTETRSWDELLNIRGDRNLRRVMDDVYSLNVESFSQSVHNQKLKVLFSDRDFALNLDDLGAGMRIAFRMFMAILLSGRSAVLAEEFDGYQHIDSLPRFVKALIGLANECQTQLFLATHSMETVRAFVDFASARPQQADLRVFQTALHKDGMFETAAFTTAEAEALMSGGFDIRKTS